MALAMLFVVASNKCCMSFALYRMTILHDRMTVVLNRMHGGHTVKCGAVRSSYDTHTVLMRFSYGCMRLNERLIRVPCERSSRDLRAVMWFLNECGFLIINY